MEMEVKLQSRSFSEEIIPPKGKYAVKSMSWAAIGGPEKATFEVTGQDTWDLLERLRCGVNIINNQGTNVWWGYVDSIVINDGNLQISISLDEMANKVRVSYSKITATGESEGKALTAWMSDTESIATYGTKEKIQFFSSGTEGEAVSFCNMLLDRFRYPLPGAKISNRSDLKAIVNCKGWWETLDWKYYNNASASSVATTSQIATIVTQCGQFFSGTDIISVSGINTSSKRDGEKTGLDEIIDLLNTGTANDLRLLAVVDENRRVKVYEEPIPNSMDMLVSKFGEFENYMGVKLDKEFVRPGSYVVLKEVLPASVDVSRMADISRFFMESVTYYPDVNRIEISPRDQTKILKFGGV
jgi:hypothetical protein